MTRLSIRWVLAVAAMLVCAGVGRAQAPVLSGGTLPQGDAQTPYSQPSLVSSGAPPYTWTVESGSVPPGLNLNTDGSISGTPSTAGLFSFTAHVTDTQPLDSNSATITIQINDQLQVTTTSLLGGTQGVSYSAPLTASGGTLSYTWSLMSVSPPAPWLSVSGASLMASTPSAGTYSV